MPSRTSSTNLIYKAGSVSIPGLLDRTVEAGETYFYIVQAKDNNAWNTQVVDEFNVIDTIAVIEAIIPGSDAPAAAHRGRGG